MMLYPAMSSRNVSLQLITDRHTLTPVFDALSNDLEGRGNLSPGWISFDDFESHTFNHELFGICYHGRLVGYVKLTFARCHHRAELAIGLKPDSRRRGIGIIALALIVRYAFEVLGMRKLCATGFEYNRPALKIYRKYFVPEGRRHDHVFWMNRTWDEELFGCSREHYAVRLQHIIGKLLDGRGHDPQGHLIKGQLYK